MSDTRLHYGLKSFVIARDREDGYVLLGGLGGLGVGEMWLKDDGIHKDDENYEDAPEQSSKGGFGR